MRGNIRSYVQVNTQASLADADPHKVIEVMMTAALDHIGKAKGAIERKDIPTKARSINRAVAIVSGLQGALDHSVNPQFARSMDDVYSYMKTRLIEASASMDVAVLDELYQLFYPILDAWRSIPDAAKQEAISRRKELGEPGKYGASAG